VLHRGEDRERGAGCRIVLAAQPALGFDELRLQPIGFAALAVLPEDRREIADCGGGVAVGFAELAVQLLDCGLQQGTRAGEVALRGGLRRNHPKATMSTVDESIPILDLGPTLAGAPGADLRLAAELRRACEEIGFYFITGHGVPQSLIDAAFAETARFHAQKLADKMKLLINDHLIGYLPLG
jgi:hypothetical protein